MDTFPQKVKKFVRSHKRSAAAIAIMGGIGLAHVALREALVFESSRIRQSPQTLHSQEQLAQCITQQRAQLGIDPVIQIDAEFEGNWPSGETKRIGEKHFQITLGSGYASEQGVQHELYHIWAGHSDASYAFFNTGLGKKLSDHGMGRVAGAIDMAVYFYHDEPTAMLYARTGWKW